MSCVRRTAHEKQILKPIIKGVVKTRIALTYLVWLYNQNKVLVLYFESFFQGKGLLKTQVYLETLRIASSIDNIDNLLFDDTIGLFNSTAVARLCRRLYGIELALEDVSNQDQLSEADWSIADELDLNNGEGAGFAPEHALKEVRKRLERRAKVQEWVVKSKEALKNDAAKGASAIDCLSANSVHLCLSRFFFENVLF